MAAPATLPRLDTCLEVGLDDQAAAGAVDDPNPGAHGLDRILVDDVSRRFGQRRVQCDEIGAGEQIVQFHLFDAEVCRTIGRKVGVVRDDLHLEALRAVRDDRSDVAAPMSPRVLP